MPQVLLRLIATWPLVAKRILAHWRLLSTVVIGVLLAAAIMSGAVVYFDALRELALKNTLAKLTPTETDILVKATRGPTSSGEYEKVSGVMSGQFDSRIAWLLRDRIRGGKSATFFLTTPGDEHMAGEDNARAYFAFLPRLMQHVTLLPGGRLPEERALGEPGGPLVLEAIVPVEAADLFDVGVGDQLSAVAFWTDATPYARVVISGIFERDDPDDDFWHMEGTVFRPSTWSSFRTAPFHVSEETLMGVLGGAFKNMDSTYAWHLSVDPTRLNSGNANLARANIDLMERQLSTTLFGYRQFTSLDEALTDYDERLFFSKLPIFVILILITVVILYYVATLSSLLVEQRRPELALLRSRGASSGQILTVFVLEGATIATLAIVVGPLLAATVISLLGLTPAFSALSGGERLDVTISGGAYAMSALGGVLSFAALMIPAVQASRVGVTQHRQQAARPTSQPFFLRYYLDVLLLVVGGVIFWQLIDQGSVVATGLFGEVVVSEMFLAVPALGLVATAMVLIRLFPLVMGIASRLLSPRLPPGLVLGLWQMARNPTHYARLSLLLILMAGLGIFAASFGGTLKRSFNERALYSTGADIRLEGIRLNSQGSTRPIAESYERIEGIQKVSPAFRGAGTDLSRLLGETYTMFAMDHRVFSEIAWFRDDFSDKPMDSLLKSLESSTVPDGIELPTNARTIGVTLKANRPHPSIAVTARIRDASDRHFNYFLGTLRSGEWLGLESSLERTSRFRRLPLQPVEPLTLVSLSFHEVDGRNRLRAGSVSIDEIYLGTTNGQRVIEPFDDISGWNVLRAVPEAAGDALQKSSISSDGVPGAATFIWSEGRALISRGMFKGPPRSPLPVLASKSFLKETDHALGEEFEVSVSGHRVPIRLVDSIDYFPTLDSIDESFLIADLSSVSRYANLEATISEFRPNEVWLSTAVNGAEHEQLIERFENDEPFYSRIIHDREATLAASQVDPLVEAGWRALLFIAFSAVLILSGIGFLVHAYVSFRSRESQFALMRTIGLSMKQLITLVWLEQALVIAAGMALGTWMGGRLGSVVMPFLGHDDRGGEVLPPFVLEVNWGTLAITYAAMTLVFALIIVGVIWFIRKISLQRILRLGEM